MIDDWLLRAILAGIGIALIAGPVGVILVWNRMAYFGDALAHSALLGVTIGYLLAMEINLPTLLVCLLFAAILAWLRELPLLATDTVLGIFSQTALAAGIAAVSLVGGVRVDLLGFLFGDLLACTWWDVAIIYGGLVVVGFLLFHVWGDMVNLTVHEDLARIDGVNIGRTRWIFYAMVAFIVAVSIKLVGALLITAMLIIPAASARLVSLTPFRMAVMATIFGLFGVLAGMGASLWWDLPSGAAIVLASSLLFMILLANHYRAMDWAKGSLP